MKPISWLKEAAKVLMATGLVILAFALVRLSEELAGAHGLLILAVVLGGTGGGFTLALIGGENYGIKLPGKHGIGVEKFDPGYLGDIFVGLMAGFLGVAVSSRGLKVELFDVHATPLVNLWFIVFSVAYMSGFLGLKLIKTLSATFLKDQSVKVSESESKESDADTAILAGNQAIKEREYDVAERQFRKAARLEGDRSIRAQTGLARVYRRVGRIGDAIMLLDEAIRAGTGREVGGRLAVAHWNRACYKIFADATSDKYKQAALEDLRLALSYQDSFRHDLWEEQDLIPLHGDPTFQKMIDADSSAGGE